MNFNTILFSATRVLFVAVTSLIIAGCGGAENSDASTTPVNTTPQTAESIVTSFTPSLNDSKVPVNVSQITVNFSKAIDPNSLNNNTFTVSDGTTGTISTTNTNTQAVFTLGSSLRRNMTYTVILNGVTDISGNPIVKDGQPFSWSFTTCGNIASSIHTINWDDVNDPDIIGYRVYYGTNSPITKSNSSFQDVGITNSWDLNASSHELLPCDNVYVAISSIGGTKGESSLSSSVSAVIE